jgi:UDP-N-acetylglucosamine:LPS N-acetylglucosamine transferase
MGYNVLILYSTAGKGHISAAEAIRDELESRENCKVNIFMDNSPVNAYWLSRAGIWLYNFMHKYCPYLYKYYARYVDRVKTHESNSFYKHTRHYFSKLFSEYSPDIILSVYPMTNHIPIRVLEDMGMRKKVKFYVFVTDPMDRILEGWGCNSAEKLYVCTDKCKQALLRMGVDKERVAITQFPLRNALCNKSDKEQVYKKLSIDSSKKVLLLNCGSSGSGYYLNYMDTIITQQEIHLIVICGNNNKLSKKLRNKYEKITVFEYCNSEEMRDILSISDYMFGKFGAATFFEAVRTNTIPLIDLSREVMPQEQGIVEYVIEKQIGIGIASEQQLEMVLNVLVNSSLDKSLKENLLHLNQQYLKMDTVADSILNNFEKSNLS